jgi:hypothetical protein
MLGLVFILDFHRAVRSTRVQIGDRHDNGVPCLDERNTGLVG